MVAVTIKFHQVSGREFCEVRMWQIIQFDGQAISIMLSWHQVSKNCETLADKVTFVSRNIPQVGDVEMFRMKER